VGDWVVSLIEKLGYLGVALLMMLENVFPPVPSELIMPLAGYQAETGRMNFWLVVLAGWAGSLAGTGLWYWVGRKVGEPRLRGWIEKHGKWFTVSDKDLDKAEDWFDKHGSMSVFIARMIPALRSIISLPAGFCGMGLSKFLIYSSIGTLVWTLGLAYAGKLLGQNYQAVDKYLGPVSWAIIGSGVLLYFWRLWKQHREEATK
jgi:membrane protein DedA with SNARE-associated domain